MKKNKPKNQKGFTLVETILYLAIVAVLLIAVIDFHLTLGGTASKLGQNINVSRNRRIALSTIDYLIRNSDGLLKDISKDCSDFDASPPVLALYFEDDDHLPGTCVEDGGGVRITINNNRVAMTCYPNIPHNGYFQACDTPIYAAGTTTYLTSPNVKVLNANLTFATSTATSSLNAFTSVTTHMKVKSFTSDQLNLSATSTATSTVVVRNEQLSGLISFWNMEDATGTDAVGDNDLTCTNHAPAVVGGLITSSTYAFDFEFDNSEYCYASNDDSLNFNNAFSMTAWLKEETSSSNDRAIINKGSWGPQKGYEFTLDDGYPQLRIFDSSSYTDYNSTYDLVNDTVYHIAVTYDLDNDEVIFYVYQKGVGGLATTTLNSVRTLVNYNAVNYFYLGDRYNFDGILDDVRIYNRVLTSQEIWALQSQGES